MKLNTYAADLRLQIFDELKSGGTPRVGEFEVALLDEGRKKGAPQMGTTRFEPNAIVYEFLYSAANVAATVFTVRVEAPERIVFLPVPEWVVESIWQGEIDGSFQFESDAKALVARFANELDPSHNAKWFQKQLAKRRD